MTIKPFEIQGAQLKLGGVQLEAGTNSVVIPGVTRATSYRVEEVEDTRDQTQVFDPVKITVIDYITYQEILNETGNGSGRADYITELDNDGYIDSLEVGGSGAYTQQEAADNASNDMYGYIGTGLGSDRPLVPQDWVQIPFRPKMRAGEVEREGGSGASSISGLSDTDIGDASPGQALVWNGEVWTNQDVQGGSSTGYTKFIVASGSPFQLNDNDVGAAVQVWQADVYLPENSNEGDVFKFTNQGGSDQTINSFENDGTIYHGMHHQASSITLLDGETLELVSRGDTEWDIIGGSIVTRLVGGGSSSGPTTKTWMNPNENTWRIEEYNGGAAVSYEGTPITSTITATATETLSDVTYVDIDDSTFPGFYGGSIMSITINGIDYMLNGNEWLGGGTTYRYHLSAATSYTMGDTITATIQTGSNPPNPVIWWDAANSMSGNEDFRGAIIEYHALCDRGTVIGKIIIAADDENAITHMESMGGSSGLSEYEFWFAPEYGQVAVRRIGTSANDHDNQIWIQWTSKIFYGSEYYC